MRVADPEREREILKKSTALLRERNGSLIKVIHSLKKAYPIIVMFTLMGVARSSYYAFSRPRSQRLSSPELLDAARQIHDSSQRSFGSRRIAQALQRQGHAVGRHRARTLM